VVVGSFFRLVHDGLMDGLRPTQTDACLLQSEIRERKVALGGLRTGASIPPETMMHFPPLFQISPPISEKFSDFLKFFYNFTFSRKIS